MKLDQVIAVRPSKTVYRDGDKCIKVFDADFSKANVLNEALNQARVEETGLNIPKVIEVTTIDGKWAIVSEFIEGKTLEKLMAENPAEREQYLEQFVELQLQVHSKTNPLLTQLKSKMNRQISMTELDATTRYDLHMRLEGMHKHKKLCHGDFDPSNIIITGAGEAYILDWSHATVGNASADAARTYLLFWLKGDKAGARRYLDLFSKKSNIAKQYIQSWIPLVAAAQSTKGNEHERELLLSWVDVVDYE